MAQGHISLSPTPKEKEGLQKIKAIDMNSPTPKEKEDLKIKAIDMNVLFDAICCRPIEISKRNA
jgi:hypothetical protein